jgi:myo-inositol-1(or 4)-monophosphatase
LQTTAVLETALEAARLAAAVHARHLGQLSVDDWDEKGAADFVTHVDREAESVVVDHIGGRFPDHHILAEEAAAGDGGVTGRKAGQDWSWIIDPLDGTTNYLHGYPMYSVSIAALHRGELVAAVVINSASGEEWTAGRGTGAFRNGAPVRISGIDRLPRALVGTGFPFKALPLLPRYTRQLAAVLRGSSGVRRAGSAALDLCHLATGWFDAFWELDLAPWDVAAGALIVREAGGVVTRLDGAHDVIGHGSILAGSPAMHAALGAVLQAADAAGAADSVDVDST